MEHQVSAALAEGMNPTQLVDYCQLYVYSSTWSSHSVHVQEHTHTHTHTNSVMQILPHNLCYVARYAASLSHIIPACGRIILALLCDSYIAKF